MGSLLKLLVVFNGEYLRADQYYRLHQVTQRVTTVPPVNKVEKRVAKANKVNKNG